MHDHGESAYKIPWRDRTQGRILLQSAKRGDIIISPKADRLFRSTLDQARSMQELDNFGIKIAILDLQLDTSTAAGKFALQVICAAAEFESGMKSERIAAAAKTRKRRKKPGIAAPPPGWYFSQKKGELVPDLIERNIIEQAFAWAGAGAQSIKTTCKWLRENDIKRRSGHLYRSDWMYQSRPAMEEGWPCEGYIRAWFSEKGDGYRAWKRQHCRRYRVRKKAANAAQAAMRMMKPETIRRLMAEEDATAVSEQRPDSNPQVDQDES